MSIGVIVRVSSQTNSPVVESGNRTAELRLRLLSAAIGLPLIGLVLYFGFWTVSAAAMLIGAIVALEARDLSSDVSRGDVSNGRVNTWVWRVLTMIVGASVPAVAILLVRVGSDQTLDTFAVAAILFAAILMVGIVFAGRFRHLKQVASGIALGYGGIVLIAVLMLPLIASLDQGRELLTFGILVVFATDTGAYFVGKRFGRRKLAPTISPGKTWEGFLGGVIFAMLASSVLGQLLSLEFSAARIALTGLAIASAGVLGDLTESWVKRVAGVKDSGTLVPGHGGLLDRLDALTPNFMLIYFVGNWLD